MSTKQLWSSIKLTLLNKWVAIWWVAIGLITLLNGEKMLTMNISEKKKKITKGGS